MCYIYRMPYKDKRRKAARGAAYYAENAERIKERERKKYRADQQRIRRRRLELSPRHKAKNAERERTRYARLRLQLIAAYGGECSCCGEAEQAFLELDHVNGDGAAHRRKIGRGSKACYAWLKKRGFPRDGYRLLCANCNQGRLRNGGTCPHQRAPHSLFGADGKSHS